DLTVGSRYVPGGSVTNWSRARVALSRVGNLYARHMLGLPVHDATSGYRVYRRGLLKDLVEEPFHADGYGFQVELVMRSTDLGAAVGEVGSAIDLGCGDGTETAELLRRGWRVLAIDAEPDGVRRLRQRVPVTDAARLDARVVRFEDLGPLPGADLVHAAWSLPF